MYLLKWMCLIILCVERGSVGHFAGVWWKAADEIYRKQNNECMLLENVKME